MTHTQPIEIDFEWAQMLDLADQHFEIAMNF